MLFVIPRQALHNDTEACIRSHNAMFVGDKGLCHSVECSPNDKSGKFIQ